MIGIVFYQRLDFSYGMTRTCSNIIRAKSLEDVSLMSTFRMSSPFVMINLVEDTLVEKDRCEGSSKRILMAHLI